MDYLQKVGGLAIASRTAILTLLALVLAAAAGWQSLKLHGELQVLRMRLDVLESNLASIRARLASEVDFGVRAP